MMWCAFLVSKIVTCKHVICSCVSMCVCRDGVLHFLSVDLDRVMFSQVCSVCLQ